MNYGKDIQRKCWNNWFFQLRLLAFTTNILEIHIHICRHSPLKTYKLTQTDDADLLVQTFYFRDFLIWKVPFVFRPLGMMAAAGLAGRSPWLATTCTIGPGALAVSHQALVHHRWQHRWACCSVLHSLMTPSGLCLWWTYPARPLAALLTFALTLCLWWTQHARPRAAPLMKLMNLCPRGWMFIDRVINSGSTWELQDFDKNLKNLKILLEKIQVLTPFYLIKNNQVIFQTNKIYLFQYI